jgi:photosystem II stability/assembly factor-like uncharacterized protein
MKKSLLLLALLTLGFASTAPVFAAPTLYNLWVQTSANMDTPDVNAFAFSPNYASDHTVFAAAYTGVFKSTDGGLTWGSTPVLDQISNSLAFSPNYAIDHTLVAGTGSGVFMTTNGGPPWVNISSNNSLLDKDILVVAFSPNYASDKTLFAGSFGNGMFKTTNINGNSTHWTAAGLNDRHFRIKSLAFSPGYAADQVMFAGAYIGDDGGGIYKSTTGGVPWTPVNSGLPEGLPPASHGSVMALVISPNYLNDQTLFAGLYAGEGVYKSTDGGNTWVFQTGTEDLYIQALAISPTYASDGTVFAGEEGGGCYLTTDGGASWRTLNAGFGDGQDILTLAIPPNQTGQPFNVFAGITGGTDGGVWQMLYQGFKVFLPLVIK